MPGKQAKILSEDQVENLLNFLASTRYPERNRLIAVLSVDAGLKASEIAALKWFNTNDPTGDIGNSLWLLKRDGTGRHIPTTERLREALIAYRLTVPHAGPFVISSERALVMSPAAIVNLFRTWSRKIGFPFSSHACRRTFIIAKAQYCLGQPLKDIQKMVGHKTLRTTRLYVANTSAPS